MTRQTLPIRYIVCPCCEGRGFSSAYLGAFTQDQLDELGPEFLHDYLDGIYDRPCDGCRGLRVVQVVDRERAERECPELLAEHDRDAEIDAEIEAAHRAEIAFGC